MNATFLHLLPVGTTRIDDTRWRVVADLDGVPLPITFEPAGDVLLVHATMNGLPVARMAADLLALNRVVRRVRVGAEDGLVTVWADLDLDLDARLDEPTLKATLSALTSTARDVLALGREAIGGPEAQLVGATG